MENEKWWVMVKVEVDSEGVGDTENVSIRCGMGSGEQWIADVGRSYDPEAIKRALYIVELQNRALAARRKRNG